MKPLLLFGLLTAAAMPLAANEAAGHAPASGHGEAAAVSPLTEGERSLSFHPEFLKADDHGTGYLLVDDEPLPVARLLVLSPWDLMELVQKLSGEELPLSRFGQGNGDELTQAWRLKVAAFAASTDGHHSVAQEDLFDPALVLWDPGTIQQKNEWGQWSVRLDRRTITQDDLPTLSPLEVRQAVEVLTARTYPVEFVLDHLEAFRAQLSVIPRVAAAAAEEAHH